MMKKITIVFVSVVLLSGCYAHICPTYSVNPEKNEIQKNNQVKIEKKQMEKTS
ncbi:lipoprotein [Catalinimonas niigatensis]|uniref:lipoprotein n=1 Tax=Catalinimonas niigatensis TaxID=1397264 RepID=UPI0038990D64